MDKIASKSRSLERMHRPAPDLDPYPDLEELKEELNFRVESDVDQAGDTATVIPRQSKRRRKMRRQHAEQAVQASPKPALAVTQPLSLLDRPHQANKPARRRFKLSRRLLIAVVAVILVGVLAVGYNFFSQSGQPGQQPALAPVAAPAQPSRQQQSDAEWEKAVQQWQCTLAEYESRQQTGTNKSAEKETSCVNEP